MCDKKINDVSEKEIKRRYYAEISRLCRPLRFRILFNFFLMLVLIVLVSGLTLFTQNTIDNISSSDSRTLLYNLLMVSGMIVLYIVAQTYLNYAGNKIVFLAKLKVREFLFSKVLYKNSINNFNSAELLRIAYEESGAVPEYYVFVKYNIYTNFIELVFYFAILLYMSWIVALIVLVILPAFVLLLHVFSVKMAQSNLETNKNISSSQSTLLQGFNGFGIIKLLRKQEYFQDIYSKKLNNEYTPAMKVSKYNAYWQTIATLVQRTFPIFLAVLTAYFYYLGLIDTLGAVTVVFMISSYLLGPIYRLTSGLQAKTMASKSFERIKPIFVDDINNFGDTEISDIHDVYIDIKKFSYDDTKEILKDFKLHLKNGDAVCIVGESGSGKSTLLKLLLNQLQVTDGRITINDISLSKISQNSYYTQVGMVSQSSYLFEQTLKENISLGDNFSDDTIYKVLNECGLQDFVDTYGIDKIIDEKNENISGGQLQRICIARTLIRKPKFVLLDEPTASLDGETAKGIVKNLLDYIHKNNSILLCVSHDKNIIDMFENKISLG